MIKVEPRGGDGMRLSPVSREWSERGLSPGWMAVNAGKRSIVLDLAKPDAIAIIHKLAREVDVVCENFQCRARRGIRQDGMLTRSLTKHGGRVRQASELPGEACELGCDEACESR